MNGTCATRSVTERASPSRARGTHPLVASFALLLLAACGGGGGGGNASAAPPPAAPASGPSPAASASPEGFWSGTTSTKRSISLVVLDDNTFYTFYSPENQPDQLAGVAQGTATVSSQTFNANDVKDFNFELPAVMDETVTANFTPRTSLDGSVTSKEGTIKFTTTFDPDYDLTPKTADAAGNYLLESASIGGQQDSVQLRVETNGSLLYQGASGCLTTGSITPRAKGNVFDLVLNFGAAPCPFPRTTLKGIAIYSAADKSLTGVAPNAARTDVALFVGAKQP